MEKILYRHNQNFGKTPTDALSVLTFETRELGNADIPAYCLEHYDFPTAARSLIEGLVKHINGEPGIEVSANGYPFILDIMLTQIRKLTGKDIRHVLWLASRQSVIDNYEGTEDNIEAYETSSVILSDLGEDGILFGYVEAPEPCAPITMAMILEGAEYEEVSYLKDINDSMELDSAGEDLAWLSNTVTTPGGRKLVLDASLRVQGDVRVTFREREYRRASRMPKELLGCYHDGKDPRELDSDYYVDFNNWFEVFVTVHENDKVLYDQSFVNDSPGDSDWKNGFADMLLEAVKDLLEN